MRPVAGERFAGSRGYLKCPPKPPFARLARADRAALVAEAEVLARFMAPEAKHHGARVG